MVFIWIWRVIPSLARKFSELYFRNRFDFSCSFVHFNVLLIKSKIFTIFKKLLRLIFLFFPNPIHICLFILSSFWVVWNHAMVNPAVVSPVISIVMNVIFHFVLRVWKQSCRFNYSKSIISWILNKYESFIRDGGCGSYFVFEMRALILFEVEFLSVCSWFFFCALAFHIYY